LFIETIPLFAIFIGLLAKKILNPIKTPLMLWYPIELKTKTMKIILLTIIGISLIGSVYRKSQILKSEQQEAIRIYTDNDLETEQKSLFGSASNVIKIKIFQ
jgi:hypothetical protein